MKNSEVLLAKTRDLAAAWAKERAIRQRRRKLEPGDFQLLREAGLHLVPVPVAHGGVWEDLARSVRPMCEMLRILAQGDSSVALVFAMHPSVLAFWRDAQPPPASGGDVANTRTAAQPENAKSFAYRLTGQKHFGSGSGVTSYMVTTAVPAGEPEPDWFFLRVGDVPWDGSSGMKLVAPQERRPRRDVASLREGGMGRR